MNHLLVVHCKMKEDLTTLAITRVGENFLQVCLKKKCGLVIFQHQSNTAPHELMIMRGGGGGGGGKYLYYNICYSLDTLGFLCVVLQ